MATTHPGTLFAGSVPSAPHTEWTPALRAGTTAKRVSREVVPSALETVNTRAEDLWNGHGRSVYALACALLGDEGAAMRAVALGMMDFAGSESGVPLHDTRRTLSSYVYRRSVELTLQTTSTVRLPTMVWLAHLAQLQRSCLALCMFGGHTYQQAAALLEVEPLEVAQMLTSGLRELTRLTTEKSVHSD